MRSILNQPLTRWPLLTLAACSIILLNQSQIKDSTMPIVSYFNTSLPDTYGIIEQMQPEKELKSLSPFSIRLFINENPQVDLNELRQRLRIGSEFGDGSDADYSEMVWGQCYECRADLYTYNLDEEASKEVLLRISEGGLYTYLIFKRAKKQPSGPDWKLLGHVDHICWWMSRPQHSLLACHGKTWLLIDVPEEHGSGYSLSRTYLYKVSPDGVKELLVFPSSGSQSWAGLIFPTQEFTASIVDCAKSDGVRVEVEFAVSYYDSNNNPYPGTLLWAKKQRAVYRSDSITGKLVLDPLTSDISEQEIEEIYENDTLSSSDIFKYNLAELKSIADGRNGKRKTWLREYLNQCKDTAEKQMLQELLDR